MTSVASDTTAEDGIPARQPFRFDHVDPADDDDLQHDLELAHQRIKEGRKRAHDDPQRAEKLLRKAMSKLESLQNVEHVTMARQIRLEIGQLCLMLDKIREVLKYCQQLMAIHPINDATREIVLSSSHLLSQTLLRCGQFDQAIRQCKHTLNSRNRLHGKDDAYFESVALMSTIYHYMGDEIEALTYESMLPADFNRPKFSPAEMIVSIEFNDCFNSSPVSSKSPKRDAKLPQRTTFKILSTDEQQSAIQTIRKEAHIPIENQQEILYWALKNGHDAVVHLLTTNWDLKGTFGRSGSDWCGMVKLNDQDGDGNTALHLAVWAKRPALVKLLVEHGASRLLRSNYDSDPFDPFDPHRSVRSNGLQLKQPTPIEIAIQLHDLGSVALLLRGGLRDYTADGHQSSWLPLRKSDCYSKSKAEYISTGPTGWSLLEHAAYSDEREFGEVLLYAGLPWTYTKYNSGPYDYRAGYMYPIGDFRTFTIEGNHEAIEYAAVKGTTVFDLAECSSASTISEMATLCAAKAQMLAREVPQRHRSSLKKMLTRLSDYR